MELTREETTCIARHLMAYQRQDRFKRKAHIMESCAECPLAVTKCAFNEPINSIMDTIFWNVFSNFCEAIGTKPEVGLNFGYLLPYDKEDN